MKLYLYIYFIYHPTSTKSVISCC